MTPEENHTPNPEGEIDLLHLARLCLGKWRWFALSVAVTLGIAVAYLQITPPVYTRTTSLLIKDSTKDNSLLGEAGALADISMFQSNVNVHNEIIALKSPAALLEMINRLRLDVSYSVRKSFRRTALYGPDLPVTVGFADLGGNDSGTLTLRLEPGGQVTLSDFALNGESLSAPQAEGRLGDSIPTPLGRVLVSPTAFYPQAADLEGEPVSVVKCAIHNLVDAYTRILSVGLSNKNATVIDLSLNDESIPRAEDILNTLVAVYNENWVKDKNLIAVSTSGFINERLKVIESELGSIDSDISSYKSKNLLPDVKAVSSLYMEQSSGIDEKILQLNNQLYMARYMRSYLAETAGKNQLLPANSGIESSGIEKQVSEYNSLQLQRNSLVANSSEQNPLAVDMDKALHSLREAVAVSVDNLVITLEAQAENLRNTGLQTTQRIASNPTQAKYLLSVERQQKIKESLYLFLLQKREENELSQAFTAYNTRLLNPPYGVFDPAKPKKRMILAGALFIGMLIPMGLVFLQETLDTKIRGRKDLSGLTIPFVGEIPLSYRPGRYSRFWKKRKEENAIVVKEKNRDVINEAFRVVRTNLEFMAGKGSKSQVILFTSINAGSGKTFTSVNLAVSLAIKGRKVLAIDLDLRRASLSEYIGSPATGISDYLCGHTDDLSAILFRGKAHKNLDVIPVGTIPPNPAEILTGERLKGIITPLRDEYDYIFLDCPPVEIVADTFIVSGAADMTFFIARAGLLERSALPELERYYANRKYNNMALLLNGTSDMYSRYGYHRYGYNSSEKK